VSPLKKLIPLLPVLLAAAALVSRINPRYGFYSG
jgi:hypothetical protein